MKNLNWLSSLKLRASYGVSGNFNIGNYDYYATLSEDNYVYGKMTELWQTVYIRQLLEIRIWAGKNGYVEFRIRIWLI